MSTNLRLDAELVEALRVASAIRGRSQQDIIREAIAKELGVGRPLTAMRRAVDTGIIEAPEPFRDVEPVLSSRVPTLDLLDRDDR